eukprot:12962456-Heterocapsa_arctica.AAC.1
MCAWAFAGDPIKRRWIRGGVWTAATTCYAHVTLYLTYITCAAPPFVTPPLVRFQGGPDVSHRSLRHPRCGDALHLDGRWVVPPLGLKGRALAAGWLDGDLCCLQCRLLLRRPP